MTIFVIADTHFGHAKLVEYTGRPHDFDARIVANWNRMVTPDDVVFHLGDVAFGQATDLAALMARLHGRKILCLGNHERHKPEWYLANGFAFACASFVFNGVVFSHEPVTSLPPGCLLNVHGHFHRDGHRDAEYRDNVFYHRHRSRYRLVEIETTLAPIPLAAVLGDRGLRAGS